MESRRPSALVLIADETDITEFAIVYNTLTLSHVTTFSQYVQHPSLGSINPKYPPTAECCIRIMPDGWFDLDRCGPDKYDLVVIPGGYGAEVMSEHPSVQELVRRFIASNKLVGMIGAGCLVAKTANLAKQPLTSCPSTKAELEKDFDYSEESVVVSKNLITSRGPGTAFAFALTLVEKLCGMEKRDEVCADMMLPPQNPL